MTLVSSPLIEALTEKPTGSSSAFEPDYLYLTRVVRTACNPITGIGLRTGPGADGSVTLALISDLDGAPNEVLYSADLTIPQSKDPSVSASVVVALPEPVMEIECFWIGFRLSKPVTLPLRIAAFVGNRSAAPMRPESISGSLIKTPLAPIVNDEKLGMPFVFAVCQYAIWGVTYGY